MTAHTSTVTTGRDGSPFYRWSCTCGKDSPTLFGSKPQAERAHSDHANAKNASK
jgi:hypothetical protein